MAVNAPLLCWLKHWKVTHSVPASRKEKKSSAWHKTIWQLHIAVAEKENDPVGFWLENANFVWHCVLFIRHFFNLPVSVTCEWEGLKAVYDIPLMVRGSAEKKCFEVWREENGFCDVSVLHPNSTGIKKLHFKSQFSLYFSFIFSSPVMLSYPPIIFCAKEEKKNLAIFNIYFTIPQEHKQKGGEVNLFSSVLLYSSILMLIPHSLF